MWVVETEVVGYLADGLVGFCKLFLDFRHRCKLDVLRGCLACFLFIFAGEDGLDLPHALDILGSEFGIKAVSLQGGGIINGAFLKAGLIDEISILIYPGIDGLSGIPSIFESVGAPDNLPAQGQSLELKSVRQLGEGVVWLRYSVHHK